MSASTATRHYDAGGHADAFKTLPLRKWPTEAPSKRPITGDQGAQIFMFQMDSAVVVDVEAARVGTGGGRGLAKSAAVVDDVVVVVVKVQMQRMRAGKSRWLDGSDTWFFCHCHALPGRRFPNILALIVLQSQG